MSDVIGCSRSEGNAVANNTQEDVILALTSREVGSKAQDSQSPNYQPDWQQVGLKDKEVKTESSRLHDADYNTRVRGHYQIEARRSITHNTI